MRERLYALPFVVVLLVMATLAMLVPALHAYVLRDLIVARAFFYSAILFGVVSVLLALALSNVRVQRQGRSHLLSLLAFFAVLPVVLAVPFSESLTNTRFFNAYFEMVSSLTTTGLTLYEPERLGPSLHLWRALVGWAGGFFVWVTAVAVMAPLNLGGFEVSSPAEVGQGATVGTTQIDRIADPSERLRRFASMLAPIYIGLTFVLWTALIIAGDSALVAICHAMSTLSTSGITPIDGIPAAGSGLAGEALIFLFMIFAVSRVTFSSDERADGWTSLRRDPELRLGLALMVTVPMFLFLRHWVAVFEDDGAATVLDGVAGLWGGFFTVTAFLTTTGWESSGWGDARQWSGLETPSLLLAGLALFGGGVATTAGGVKLLRVYALYKHGIREMEKLVQPSSIGGSGQAARRFRRHGAYVAWVFFMLFALSIALVMLALSLTGIVFENAMVLTIAALSTTGPLAHVSGEAPGALGSLPASAKGILAAAMVVGRLEALAIIALLNPDFWR